MAKKISTKKKKIKLKSVRYYGLNITLQSDERGGPETYLELIKKINEDQLSYTVGPEITMVLRTKFQKMYEFNGKEYPVLYGKLLRFNTIKNWYNQKMQVFQEYSLPAGIVPNAFETDYVFIPEAHKFFIKYNNRINIFQTRTFITKALSDLTVTEERIKVNVMSSSDKIDAILSANVIKSLDVEVSYTNDDIGNEAEELIDKMLKQAQSGEVSIRLRPDANGTLNSESDLVRGFVGVGKNNGNVTARIINIDGKSETVKTAKYPEKIDLKVEEVNGQKGDEKLPLFERIMSEFRIRKKKK